MTKKLRNYIDGQWSPATSTFEARNPANDQVIAEVADSGPAEVDAAVAAARAAFATWRHVNPSVRARYLHAIGDRVKARESELAQAITTEMGKTIGEATGEVDKLAKAFHFYAEEASRVHGEVIPNDVDGFHSLAVREPIGVVGAITPWNYPLELVGWKLCAAVAAGCTIVVKPSQYASLSPVLLFECIDDAGLPGGVANLVLGAGAAGPALAAHAGLDKLAFTGSTATGNTIARNVPRAMPLTMELGGTCPMIVTEHADIKAAVTGAARRGFRNAGQICIAINRIYVHRSVYSDFVDGLTSAVAALRAGNGMDPAMDVGPMATRAGVDVVEAHVKDAVAHGATVTTGGDRIPELAPGYFFEPTVVAGCTPEMRVMCEETFGPVVGVMAYDDLADAIAWANGTESGLAAYVYTQDLRQAHDLGRRLDFGNVAVNNVDAGIMNAPYGGRKGSGFGVEHGKAGLEGYLQHKHIRIRYGAE
ncbi:aldehyde dehydrogenase family protein [Mycobacterium aquaticum]|uniref:NAD-dependent succinate-semialdehyde dehydrogenase n=1 Tax=Mycobacterium aquaticum TaxID=1927124 RepID=A0A1X0BA25_9MYCO|nr:aldehyde dehydrogenase family protein [Mycobacterium aquaticum]ORA39192.1 NAD-dependent succinate-semialdehyde dehydrogenase [Mycobacterium aquaticum]